MKTISQSGINRKKINKVLLITGFWIGAAVYYTIFEYLSVEYFSKASNNFNLATELLTNTSMVFIAGLILGTIEVFYLSARQRKQSYAFLIIFKSIFYLICMFIFYLIGFFFFHYTTFGNGPFEPEVIQKLIYTLFEKQFVSIFIYWFFVMVSTQFFLLIGEKFGQGIIFKFLMGRYHRSKEEERIFMFLDIKSSTTIAEKLGHVKYYDFLNEFYSDITDAILQRKGEIYQYVGDEIVVSWSMPNGLEKSNCINCFIDILHVIDELSPKYLKRFGIIPEFKSGFHFGWVTTGEIGVIKKEIIFSGDVLNTTSRIQEQCNAYNTIILASQELVEILPENNSFKTINKGSIQLRGKMAELNIYSIDTKLE